MSDTSPARSGWTLPVLLAVSTAAAVGLGFLYLTRPSAGELGAIRVVVADDEGRTGNGIRVVVAEAPLVQKEVVSPGGVYAGVVYYPLPYRTKPNLKLTSGKRQYEVTAETEVGFTWVARLLPDDLREDARKDANILDRILGDSVATAAANGRLRGGLVFEDFNWEAKGLRAPPSSLPPRTFEQTGRFYSVAGQESPVSFAVPYDSPPQVELSGNYRQATVILECTAKGFKWKNVGKGGTWETGEVTWTTRGVRGETPPK